jgi:hypothetical protein
VGITGSIKAIVNHFLRLGLTATKRPARKPFAVTPRKLQLPPGSPTTTLKKLVEDLEGPAHRCLAERSMLPHSDLLTFSGLR